MADLAGELQLVGEALDGRFIEDGLGPNKLQSDFSHDLGVLNLVDSAHAAMPQLLDDLVTASEGRACGQFADGGLNCYHDLGMNIPGRRERRAALVAEFQRLGIIGMAFRARDGHH